MLFSLVADFNGDMNELLHTPSDDTLPVLPPRNMMLFPGVVGSVTVGRESSLKVVEQSKKRESLIAVFAQKDSSVEDPDKDDLYDEGCWHASCVPLRFRMVQRWLFCNVTDPLNWRN